VVFKESMEIRFKAILSFVVLTFLFATVSLHAQLPTGTILGQVKDSSGAVVPGATVTIRNVDTSQSRTATTGEDGSYRVPALAVGHYDVRVEHEGFKGETQTGIVLDVSQEAVLNFTMQIGATSQEVVVTGEAPVVNTTNGELGGLVNEDKMSDLPLNGRNYIDLSLMQAGVTNDANYGGSTAQGGTNGIWFSANGSPVRSNNFTLDGAMLMNQRGTTSAAVGITLGVDGIKEYKVITNNFGAEYGMTMGSQTVIVSKSGTNQIHGDLFEYLRNSALDARNYFDGSKIPEFRRNNFGGAAGGPIRKDKTFVFGVYEGLRQDFGFTDSDTVFPAACHAANNVITSACIPGLATPFTVPASIRPLLALYPLPNLTTTTFAQATSNPTRVDYGQIRVDQNFSASDTFFGRYTIDDSFNTNYAAAKQNPTGFPEFRSGTQGRDQFLTLSENHIFSGTLLNTARLSFSRTDLNYSNLYATSVVGPQYSFVPGEPTGDITIGGLPQLGPNTLFPQVALQDIYTLSDDVYFTKGRHALKFGVLINRFDEGENSSVNAEGSVTFASQMTFLQGIPANFSALTPGSNLSRNFIYETYGLYAGDDFHVASRLTLNLGLRYEFNTTPNETGGFQSRYLNILTSPTYSLGPVLDNPSLKNFSPRVGLAWDVTGKGKTSLRAGFGEYYDVGNFGFVLEQAPQSTPPFSSTSSFVAPAGYNTVLTVPFTFPGPANSLHTVNYNAKQPYVLSYNMTLEQQLPFNMGLAVSYVGSRGVHLWQSREGNPCLPTGDPSLVAAASDPNPRWAASCGTAAQPRINQALGSVEFHTTNGDSSYNSLQAVLTKRVTRGLEFQGAYTWGRAFDTTEGQGLSGDCVSGGAAEPTDPFRSAIDKGPSCFDAAQNFRFNMLYHFMNLKTDNRALSLLTHGWWVGSIVSLQTGYPFTPLVTTLRSQSGNLAALAGSSDRASVNTAASIAAAGPCTAATGANPCAYTPIPYNQSTVTIGTAKEWYNPAMFSLGPVGRLGDASRDMLRGPALHNFDFSLVKDTAVPKLGEAGSIEFRAELFNILNFSNLGMPNGTVFGGALNHPDPFQEAPNSGAGVISNTVTTSRQIQFALRVVF
jgi:hypothetical protein